MLDESSLHNTVNYNGHELVHTVNRLESVGCSVRKVLDVRQ